MALWWPCFCSGGSGCTWCTAWPISAPTLTIAGFPDTTPSWDCRQYNGSHATSIYITCGALTPVWQTAIFVTYGQIFGYVETSLPSGNWGLKVKLFYLSTLLCQWTWDSGGTSPFDCAATRTMTLGYTHPSHLCTSSGGPFTCQWN